VGVGVGPGVGADLGAGLGLGDQVPECEPPPPFPHRRVASATGLRPHLTIKIDHTLRAAAHQAAADEGYSLSQVVETILDRYLEQGLGDQPVMRSTKIMRHASAASTGTPASKAP
jgi:hypothetical protein